MKPIKIANLKLFDHEPGEKIIGEARRHPIGLIVVLANGLLIIAVLDLLLFLLIKNQAHLRETYSFLSSVNIIAVSTWVVAIVTLLVFLGGLMAAYVYRHNYLVLTDEKVVLVRTYSLAKRKVSELNIGDIHDVTVAQATILSRLFNYGTVMLKSSGSTATMWLSYVSHPFECSNAIMAAHEADLRLYGN